MKKVLFAFALSLVCAHLSSQTLDFVLADHGVGSPDHSGISYGVIQKLKNDQENRPR